MDEYTEIELSSGITVRCAAAPHMATAEIVAQHPECQRPDAPIEEIQSKGSKTVVLARPGTPQYEQWKAENARVERAIERVEHTAPYFLGILEWKMPDEDTFSENVPDDWEFPKRLRRMRVEPRSGEDGHLWDFIEYELLKSVSDTREIQQVVYGIQPLTAQEVKTAEASFQGDEAREANT